MKKYDRRGYNAYLRYIERFNIKHPKFQLKPSTYDMWKKAQPIMDDVTGQLNGLIKEE